MRVYTLAVNRSGRVSLLKLHYELILLFSNKTGSKVKVIKQSKV